MVTRGNKRSDGIGGHISTFASSARCRSGVQSILRGRGETVIRADSIYFPRPRFARDVQPCVLEGRLSEENLENFRANWPTVAGYPAIRHLG